jgi:diguanylate cyclase (GGDEF)-like protein
MWSKAMSELEHLIQWVEHARHAVAVYQYVDGKVKTVCVSDGLFEMMHSPDEPDKAALIARYATNMYRNTVPEDAARVAAEAKRFAQQGGKYEVIYRERVYQRETYSLTHSVGYHYYLKDGSRVAIVVYTCIDEGISAHQRAELNSETAFRSFLNHSDIAIAVVKQVDGELVYCNQSMRGILHPVNNFDTGMTLAEYVKGQRDPALLGHIAALAGKGNQLVQIDGKDTIMRVMPMTYKEQPVYTIESDPWDTLYHDALTGLPNMSWFRYHVSAHLRKIQADGGEAAFIYMNLYGMKGYNIKFGFSAGDRLLKHLADTLKQVFDGELVCRSSEDHFMVLTRTENLEEKLKAVRGEVQKAALGKFLEMKAGIYTSRVTAANNQIPYVSEAYDHARLACATIKENARKSWAYFDGGVADDYEQQLYVLAHFQQAMDERWIEIYYQPVCQVGTGQLSGYECLARWHDPDRGILSPAAFVPALEQHHLIGLLDHYILDTVCREAAERRQKGLGDIPISFNVSRDDFNDGDVFQDVCDITAKYGIDPSLIDIEITESAFSDDPDYIGAQVKRFRDAGFSVWMDDFGSEYSSLGTLQKMDVDLIKLDIRFLRACEEEP